jgi:hypothetical protein
MLMMGESLLLAAIGLVCCLLLLLLQLYFRHKFSYWRKRGVPYSEPAFLFGNFKDCLLQKECVGQFMQRMYNEGADKPFYGIYVFTRYNSNSLKHNVPIPSSISIYGDLRHRKNSKN